MSSAESRARELVERLEEALDRQSDYADGESWPHAPVHIREGHGAPNLPEPPSREAMDAWVTWLVDRRHSLWRCRENLERGRMAVRDDPARAEIHWRRASSTAERVLAEIDDRPDGLEREAEEHEDVPDDVIADFLALLEEHRGRQVVNDSVLPAPAVRLRAALERRYQRSFDPALAEALIALPVFVPPEDAVAVDRYLLRRTGEVGPIGRATWDRGLTVVKRIAGEQRVVMRRTLHASGSGVTSPIPILGALADSHAGAAALGAVASYDASLAWTVAAYGASGLATLIVIGVVAILVGEPVGPLVLVQSALLVVGFLPALEVMHRVAGALARRVAKAGKPPGSTDSFVVVLPFVTPIGIALVAWLVVTAQ